MAANVFLALVQGWTTLSPFSAGDFVDAYILLPLFPVIWFAYKWITGAQFKRAAEIDLDEGRRSDVEPSKRISDEEDVQRKGSHAKSLPAWKRLWQNF